MFMAIGVSSGQFMMDVLRDGKRRQHKEQNNKTGRQACSQPINETDITHSRLRTEYHNSKSPVK